jgi:biopolymer transport protein ExbB
MEFVNRLMPEWFVAGGPVMWVILLGSLLSLWVLIEKTWTLRPKAVLQPTVASTVRTLSRAGQIEEACNHCAENPGPYASIAGAAIDASPFGAQEVRVAVTAAGRQEAARLERFLPIVRTVASVSPLLGLFGTVLGMIQVFAAISQTGLGQAEELSSGIQQALITTAFGLAVAIPSLVIFNAVHAKVQQLTLSMERDIIELITTLVRRQSSAGGPAQESA